METTPYQSEMFVGLGTGLRAISERCALRADGTHGVVLVCGAPWLPFHVRDRAEEALAMVSLVNAELANQREVAAAFGRATRTVRRYQRRYESAGLAGLLKPPGYPRGRARLPRSRVEEVEQLKSEGLSNREVAHRLHVSEKAIRKLLRRRGWRPPRATQLALKLGPRDADPNVSGRASAPPGEAVKAAARNADAKAPAPPEKNAGSASVAGVAGADPNVSGRASAPPGKAVKAAVRDADAKAPEPPEKNAGSASVAGVTGADPNVSGPADEDVAITFDTDPSNRSFDRLMAYLGGLDDAAPLFQPGERIPHAGVLLAVPALVHSGVFDVARRVYGSIGPAFYGLRTSLMMMLLMALLRIKRPEGLKEAPPRELGRVVGLDRAPEVKTIRRKLKRLAELGRAVTFGREMALRRVKDRGSAVGFLYVDGHVRVYHGVRTLPKAHVTRMRISLPATTDYWVNDMAGDPLFVLTAPANAGLVRMMPAILAEVRALVGKDRRVTLVFDRGGFSPKLFHKIITADGFDILTYRKGRLPALPDSDFSEVSAVLDGREVSFTLADQEVSFLGGKLTLRQVTRRTDDGHQTPILTSRRDLPAIEVAWRMFERWRQENFFKYMRDEFAIDALVDYAVEPDDAARTVPNPARKAVDAQLREARAELARHLAQYGDKAISNPEAVRRTMRGFKIAHGKLGKTIRAATKRIADLEARRAAIPDRVPVGDVVQGQVVKLASERKHLTNLLKMVAYQAESDLVRLVTPHYARVEDEGRTLIQSALAASADILLWDNEILVRLQPMSSPHRTRAIAELCRAVNESSVPFPGTRLRLRFEVATGRSETSEPDRP